MGDTRRRWPQTLDMSAYDGLVFTHASTGAVGLLTMLVALIAAKGTRAHRRIGGVFAVAMALTSVTGLLVALSWIVVPSAVRSLPTDPTLAAYAVMRLHNAGLFFAVLSLVTGHAVLFGVLASRERDRDPTTHPLARVVSVALAITALFALAGLRHGFDAFLAFGGTLGLVNAIRSLRPERTRTPWLRIHVQAMLGACTAATTAFVVQTSAHVSSNTWVGALAWTVPVALGVFGSAMWTRRLRTRKMDGDAA